VSFNKGAVTGAFVDLLPGFVGNDGRGFNGESIANVETVEGTKFADTLLGDPFANRLFGLAGADFFDSRDGNDLLVGGPDGDQLLAGIGDDVVQPGPDPSVASNFADGDGGSLAGPGTDTIRYAGVGPPGVSVDLATATTTGAQFDTIPGFESVTGTGFDDQLIALLPGTPSLAGGKGGNDVINTADGDSADTADGGSGEFDDCFVDPGEARSRCEFP
jgi:hypothetical protein